MTDRSHYQDLLARLHAGDTLTPLEFVIIAAGDVMGPLSAAELAGLRYVITEQAAKIYKQDKTIAKLRLESVTKP